MKMQWALITGASSGFGKAIAEKLAAQKMNLILTGRRHERLEDIAKTLRAENRVEIKILNFDVSSWESCENKFAEVRDVAPDIEVLINNAGLARGTAKVQDAEVEDWEAMIDTNIKGLMYMTRLVLPYMIEKNSGSIVNIGSVAGHWTYPGGAVYSATKFAVRGFTESLRMDLLGKNIRVTEIAPGMAETEFSEVRLGDAGKAKKVYEGMTPLSANDIAEAVSWCLDRPKHVNISELIIFPTDQVGVGPSYTHRKEQV